jgi:hypothetical protein
MQVCIIWWLKSPALKYSVVDAFSVRKIRDISLDYNCSKMFQLCLCEIIYLHAWGFSQEHHVFNKIIVSIVIRIAIDTFFHRFLIRFSFGQNRLIIAGQTIPFTSWNEWKKKLSAEHGICSIRNSRTFKIGISVARAIHHEVLAVYRRYNKLIFSVWIFCRFEEIRASTSELF